LTLTGQIELNVENFRGILEYTNVLVRIQYKNGQIKVNGRNLQIEYYTRDEMKLVGHIDSLEFVSRNQMNKNTF
jgi:sporulation protein YqfC